MMHRPNTFIYTDDEWNFDAVFCGHDHYNNFSIDYKGIRLTYGMSVDYLAYPGIYKEGTQRGCTIITFSPDGKTVYGITFNGISGLYAYDLTTGAEKWRYIPETNGGSYNPGTVNPVTGEKIYQIVTIAEYKYLEWKGQKHVFELHKVLNKDLYNQKMMALYKKNGYSMFGACLPNRV